MSVHGANSPHTEQAFSSTVSGAGIFKPARFGSAPTRPVGPRDIVEAYDGETPAGRPASGIYSYWFGDTPADVQISMRRLAGLAGKRTIDIVGAGLILLFLLPLLAIVAIAIKVSDPGPALFRQVRMGKDGRRFTILKFRSMYLDRCSDDGVAQTVSQDARVMPLGNFIRRTSIDELPQLINVLKGDMSLVGPRPHVEGQLAGGKPYAEVLPCYEYRLLMRPGLTGWAQANGYRGPTDNVARASLRIEHDVAYIQNFSLALDLKIMLRTLRREFIGGTGF